MAERELVIGIDLGTTNSVVATVHGAQPSVIKTRTGNVLTPSVVAVAKDGRRLVGQIAKRQAITNPEATVFGAKRLIGRKFSSSQVQAALPTLPYHVRSGEHDDVRILLGGQPVSLPEISAMVLRELKQDAEASLGRPVRKAVITVPAYFNDGQRQATKDAGLIAGLEVLRIINEPTAAALAYGYGRSMNGRIVVFDLGGGTFDISVLEVGSGVFDVLATGGDTFLGGEDFDQRVIAWLIEGFAKEHGVNLAKDRMALQRLKDAAEKAKIDLSATTEVQISLPFISTPSDGGNTLHLQTTLTRGQLEAMTADLVEKTIRLTDQVLKDARVAPRELKEVILVGGMTRMPKVVDAVRAYFGRDPCKGVHPEEVVALGAAVQADSLVNHLTDVLLLDVTPQSLGVAIAGGYVRQLIPKNTTVPTATTQVFTTSRDAQTVVRIMVLQGESEVAHQNELLGEFVLEGLREARRGEVQVDVTFDISAEGIVSVAAHDRETGQRQSITVTASGGLTPSELKSIIDAQADELLEVKSGEELLGKRGELRVMLGELDGILPAVRRLTEGTELGADALTKARLTSEAAQRALAGDDLTQVNASIEQLARMLSMLRGVMERIGSAR